MKHSCLRKIYTSVSLFLAVFLFTSVTVSSDVSAANTPVQTTPLYNTTILPSINFDGASYPVTNKEDMAWQVLNLVNKERAANGLAPLTMDKKLMATAVGRAAETTVLFDHTRPNGTSCFTAFPDGIGYAGENIAAGYPSASSVVSAWMNSSGHRANILNPNFKSIGIGCVYQSTGYGYYWAQSFGDVVLQNASTKNLYEVDGIDYGAVFDANFYFNKYTDIRKAYGSDSAKALQHFINYGMKEGRQGISSFDVHSYKNAYADLRLAYGNNLKSYYIHYINHGKKEGRVATGVTTVKNPVTTLNGINYSSIYNFNYYQNKYADIKKAFGNDDIATLNHFINHGMKEGRQGIDSFDVYSYKNAYADLRLAYGNNLKNYYIHYLNHGKKEGRVSTGVATIKNPVTTLNGINYSSVYDFYYYQSKYPDIKKAYGNDDVATLKHFINYGMREGRQASSSFNLITYKYNYPDLQRAYGNDNAKYYMHYINYGKREGRTATVNLNPISPATFDFTKADEPEEVIETDIESANLTENENIENTIPDASATDALEE